MFRFWSSDSRGCDKTVEAIQHMPGLIKSTPSVVAFPTKARPLKRRRSSVDAAVPPVTPEKAISAKRIKKEDAVDVTQVATASRSEVHDAPGCAMDSDIDRAKEVIQYQFSLEILLKHDELRLIDQELAKCQIALEQLRRCHLLPYPTMCPTPQQMLDISSGKGAAVRPRPGEAVPKWAPPFGVVDGPYARHYAKWLIPDPVFDGALPDWPGFVGTNPSKSMVEGRTTRNSLADPALLGKHRPVRGATGQKLHALSSGYPQPKDKAGPCILKRADGQTVKLVCIDCHRDNFSSTQGFINHCRIAHKRDFKSHEEAAVHCGHPIEVDEAPSTSVPEERPSATPASGLVHPYARADKETCDALLSRLDSSLKLFSDGKLPGVVSIPASASSARSKAPSAFVGSDKTPYLSRLMQSKKLGGNLSACVEDAKTIDDLDEYLSSSTGEESEDERQAENGTDAAYPPDAHVARTPVVMRVPARQMGNASTLAAVPRPTSSKGRSPHMSFSLPNIPSTRVGGDKEDEDSPMYDDDEMGPDLSPNTMASNTAPSLVSDDGEYDDSDDGSSSDASDSDAESVSDVPEINTDEDEVEGHGTPRGLRHHRGSTGAAVKLKKDEPKHVTFVSPVRGGGKGRRKQNV